MKTILKPGRNCQGIYETLEAGLFIDGQDYYRAFYRAASQARRYILLAGWQFDSRVALLRGKDLKEGEVLLLPFLRSLCARNHELEIRILAWDFSFVFSLDREWFQEWIFNEWSQTRQIRFRFDSTHAIGASHHQKYAVIDGWAGFLGGMDLCSARWDDRRHKPENPFRKDSGGNYYGPYHDVQSYFAGPAAAVLAELFARRWANAGGGKLDLPPPESHDFRIGPSASLKANRVALSRTAAKTLLPLQDSIREIRNLYLDAIASAEELIYLENQYFTSLDIYRALLKRMQSKGGQPLQIVLILPREPNAWVEEIALTTAQTRILKSLREEARKFGHDLGVYFPASWEKGKPVATYVHSKLLLVDDRFLTVGSANATNRSMGLDTELNASWEADPVRDSRLIRSIRHIRVNLLQEHTGLHRLGDRRRLRRAGGLVSFLNKASGTDSYRLHFYQPPEASAFIEWMNGLAEDLPIDADKPVLEENLFEMISGHPSGFFASGIVLLNRLINTPAENQGRDRAPTDSAEDQKQKNIRRRFPIRRWILYLTPIGILLFSIWVLFFWD